MPLRAHYLIALIILSFSCESTPRQEGFYTIVVPGTIRSESSLHMSIALSDFSQSCWFNVSLKYIHGQIEYHQRLKTIEVYPNTVQLVELQVSNLISKRGTLEVLGYRGIISRDLAEINFEYDSHSVFIQTNKAKYKLGELVQFRIICIDHLTRPAKIDKTIIVLIYDSEENLIKQITNVKLVKGVFKGEFQLSDNTILGEWKIQVEMDGNKVAEKSFQVAKYVVPKFWVRISTKSNVALEDNKIILGIKANYFYGEPVKGNLTIVLKKTYSAIQMPHSINPIFMKQLEINESTRLILDMQSDLEIQNIFEFTGPKILYKINVKAIVTDALTEQQSMAESEIVVHNQQFIIKIQAPKVFDGSETVLKFPVKILITDLDHKPIVDSESKVKITVECKTNLIPVKAEFFHVIGKENTNIEIENQNLSSCQLFAEYKGAKSYAEEMRRNKDTFYLDVLTESPEVGKNLKVKLKSLDPIENFSYDIVSKGDIIESNRIIVPENEKTHIFQINVTFAMVPKITIYVHRIKKRIFKGQLKEVYIKRTFQNSIEIMTDTEAKPGSLVNVNVSTDEGSYVGFMGLDHRILENLDDLSNDLTENLFYTKLRDYDALSIDSSSYPGQKAGLVTFSNALTKVGTRFDSEISSVFFDSDSKTDVLPDPFEKPSLELPRIRKMFSESWLYKDFESTPVGGLSFMEIVPDTITSWAISGFALNPKTGLTLTKNATNLKVFQQFFVSIDSPNLVTEGETIEVPIYISNYLSSDALTNIIIETETDQLQIFKQPEILLRPRESISKHVPAGKREKITVFLKPLEPGKVVVTVKALSSEASDAVQKVLNVKSEGISYEYSKTHLVHLPEETTQEDEITIHMPKQAVPGSERVEVSVVGDTFRPLLGSLQDMARVPYGNGEENMRFIISNLLFLNYHKALSYNHPSLENKIRLNIELGYQNQLCFKHLDGSFGQFERTMERSGDIWQTAFALWGLKQSSDFIHVDSKVFQRGLNYLKSRQEENGSFKSRGGVEEDVEHTALSLLVFLMDKQWRISHSEVLTKGLSYLFQVFDNLRPSPSSVLATYVMILGRHEKAEDCYKNLTTHLLLSRKKLILKKPDTLQSHLETTTEILMNLFESQTKFGQILLPIIKGLIAGDDGKSSLAHIIAMHAMLVFVKDLNLNKKNLMTSFRDDQNRSGEFHLNANNSEVLQTFTLSDKSRRIQLVSKGYGFAVINVKYKYNSLLEDHASSNYVANIYTQSSSNSLVIFEVCVRDIRNTSEEQLMVMEVSLQSGYEFTEKITHEDALTRRIKSIKVNSNQDKLTVHIANVRNNGICIKLETLKRYKVLNVKSGWLVVYDAYKKGEKSAKSFKLDDT